MIAQTLIKQLGTALPMLGAQQLVDLGDGLQFGIRGCSKRGNKIVIKLSPDDTYTIELWKIRGVDCRQMTTVEMVYADGLHTALESMTGLRCRL